MDKHSHLNKEPAANDGQSACEGVEKLLLLAVAVLLATAGVAWLVMVWE